MPSGGYYIDKPQVHKSPSSESYSKQRKRETQKERKEERKHAAGRPMANWVQINTVSMQAKRNLKADKSVPIGSPWETKWTNRRPWEGPLLPLEAVGTWGRCVCSRYRNKSGLLCDQEHRGDMLLQNISDLCWTTKCYILEDRTLYSQHCENIKSCKYIVEWGLSSQEMTFSAGCDLTATLVTTGYPLKFKLLIWKTHPHTHTDWKPDIQ